MFPNLLQGPLLISDPASEAALLPLSLVKQPEGEFGVGVGGGAVQGYSAPGLLLFTSHLLVATRIGISRPATEELLSSDKLQRAPSVPCVQPSWSYQGIYAFLGLRKGK